jgi:hypothetical protein
MPTQLQPHQLTVSRSGDDLIIEAEASVPTLGWSDARLEQVTRSSTSLELRLVANPPEGFAAQMMADVRASLRVAADGLHDVSVGALRRPTPR